MARCFAFPNIIESRLGVFRLRKQRPINSIISIQYLPIAIYGDNFATIAGSLLGPQPTSAITARLPDNITAVPAYNINVTYPYKPIILVPSWLDSPLFLHFWPFFSLCPSKQNVRLRLCMARN